MGPSFGGRHRFLLPYLFPSVKNWQEVGGAKNCTIFDCAPNSNNWPDLLTKRYTELSGDGTALATIDTNFYA